MKSIFVCFALIISLLACSRNNSESNVDMAKEVAVTAAVTESDQAGKSSESTIDDDLPHTKPLLTKNAVLEIEVDNLKKSKNEINQLIKNFSAYTSNDNQTNDNYALVNTSTIRVSPQNFDTLLSCIEALGIKINTKQISITDISEEYVDLESRIKTKKDVENQYRQLLNKASKISDILEIEEKLRIIREEIEAAEGRIRYLKNQVELSKIELTIKQILDYKYTPESGPGFFGKIWKSIVGGWQAVVSIVVVLFAFWPLFLVVAIVFYIIKKRKKAKLNP